MSVTDKWLYPYYTASYNYFGNWSSDDIELADKVEYPASSGSGAITGNLSVYSEGFYEKGQTYPNSNWEVGTNHGAGVVLTCPQGYSQRIQWQQEAGQISENTSITMNWNFSDSWFQFVGNLSFGWGGSSAEGTNEQDRNNGYVGAVWTQPGQYLNHYNPYYPNQDDYVAASWTAPQVTNDGPAAYVTDNVNFAYDMYQPWASGADYQENDLISFTTYAD